MGTRSLVVFKDANFNEDAAEITVLYRQFDGYPTGMGKDILECFKGRKVVNGYNDNRQINGAGDMCVQLIAFLKERDAVSLDGDPLPINSAGGLYLHPPRTRGLGAEYVYTLVCPKYGEEEKGLLLVVEEDWKDKILYEGPLDNFDPQTAESENEDG